MWRASGVDKTNVEVLISERGEFGLGKGVHGTNGWRSPFFKFNLEVIGTV